MSYSLCYLLKNLVVSVSFSIRPKIMAIFGFSIGFGPKQNHGFCPRLAGRTPEQGEEGSNCVTPKLMMLRSKNVVKFGREGSTFFSKNTVDVIYGW